MTKLKLNFSQDAASILSREELKQVLGGTGSGELDHWKGSNTSGSGTNCDSYYASCDGRYYSCFWDINRNACYNKHCGEICRK